MIAALVLALGLAMDAAAASAVRGMIAPALRGRDVALVAALTGGFQAAMAAVGWVAGAELGRWFARYDHWVAFTILVALGGKAVVGALRDRDDAAPIDPFAVRGLVLMAIATSIDALAAGVTVPLLDAPPAFTIVAIGAVTAALSIAGLYVGRALGARLGGKLEIVGGLALIAIGAKILLDHR